MDIGQSTRIGEAVVRGWSSRGPAPRILGLGEPAHGEEEFCRLRNALFRYLAEREGFRTIALESDCWAGRVLDGWARGGPGDLDDVLARGFSPHFAGLAGNRHLLEWARGYNDGRRAAEQVRVTGFDAPTELVFAHSPRSALAHLYRYLAEHAVVPCAWETVDDLLGPDAAWTDPAAALDPADSIGSTERVRDLRVLADDLARTLACEAPAMRRTGGADAVEDAELAARTASGLLAYHAAMAVPGDPARRWQRLSALRDAMMADNLVALAARGPVLAFAHNQHVRTGTARLELHHPVTGPMTVHWQPVGAHLASRLGAGYRTVAMAAGRSGRRGAGEPDTREGVVLDARGPGDHLVPAEDLRGAHPGGVPLADPALGEVDSVLFAGGAG